jgi:hypothetical protein
MTSYHKSSLINGLEPVRYEKFYEPSVFTGYESPYVNTYATNYSAKFSSNEDMKQLGGSRSQKNVDIVYNTMNLPRALVKSVKKGVMSLKKIKLPGTKKNGKSKKNSKTAKHKKMKKTKGKGKKGKKARRGTKKQRGGNQGYGFDPEGAKVHSALANPMPHAKYHTYGSHELKAPRAL